MLAHIINPRTQDAEGQWISKFKSILVYILKSCLQINIEFGEHILLKIVWFFSVNFVDSNIMSQCQKTGHTG